MTRRILIELALFLTPFLIFFLYRANSRHMSVKDRWPVIALGTAGFVLAAGALIFVALREPSDNNYCYQARYLEDGVWKGGDKRPCNEIVTPKSTGANSAARDALERVQAGDIEEANPPTVVEDMSETSPAVSAPEESQAPDEQ